ncbi:MAG: response regulator [Thermoanaerobaculia bacterium]|jgi:two-component system chemotaxis response regulator CheY
MNESAARFIRKILVVDDSELLHRMYDLILRRYRDEGTVVLHARDGLECLTMHREHPDIDLILLDVNMPNLTGIEVMARLRSSNALRAMKVIMVSTEGREADVAKAVELGASGYVTKPFSPTDLHHQIDSILAERRAMAPMGGA